MSKVEIIFDIFDILWYTEVWLESPKSQLSKTFFGIENPLNIKEVMSKNMFVCIWAFHQLFKTVCGCSFPIFDIFNIHNITALRCIWSIFDIDSITFKPYHIKKVMSKNVCVCSFSVCVCSFPIFDLRCIWSIFDIFNIDSITFKENFRMTSPTSSTCHIPCTLFKLQCRL